MAEAEQQGGGVEVAERPEGGEFQVDLVDTEGEAGSENEAGAETDPFGGSSVYREIDGRWVTGTLTTREGTVLTGSEFMPADGHDGMAHDMAVKAQVTGLARGESLVREKAGQSLEGDNVMFQTIYMKTREGELVVTTGQRALESLEASGGGSESAGHNESRDFGSEGGHAAAAELTGTLGASLTERTPIFDTAGTPTPKPKAETKAKPGPKPEQTHPWWQRMAEQPIPAPRDNTESKSDKVGAPSIFQEPSEPAVKDTPAAILPATTKPKLEPKVESTVASKSEPKPGRRPESNSEPKTDLRSESDASHVTPNEIGPSDPSEPSGGNEAAHPIDAATLEPSETAGQMEALPVEAQDAPATVFEAEIDTPAAAESVGIKSAEIESADEIISNTSTEQTYAEAPDALEPQEVPAVAETLTHIEPSATEQAAAELTIAEPILDEEVIESIDVPDVSEVAYEIGDDINEIDVIDAPDHVEPAQVRPKTTEARPAAAREEVVQEEVVQIEQVQLETTAPDDTILEVSDDNQAEVWEPAETAIAEKKPVAAQVHEDWAADFGSAPAALPAEEHRRLHPAAEILMPNLSETIVRQYFTTAPPPDDDLVIAFEQSDGRRTTARRRTSTRTTAA